MNKIFLSSGLRSNEEGGLVKGRGNLLMALGGKNKAIQEQSQTAREKRGFFREVVFELGL